VIYWLQQLVNGLSLGAIFALIALGYTMVYGVLKLINFAHGDILMVGAFVAIYAAMWADYYGIPPWFPLIMPISMAFCAVLGVIIEFVAYRPLRNAPRLSALITAIGVSLFLESVGQWKLGAGRKPFPKLLDDHRIEWLAENYDFIIYISDVVIFVSTLLLLVALQFVVKHTRFGKAMRAVSQDPEAAQLMGVNVNRVITWTFALGSALAGAGGVMWGMKFEAADPLMGMDPGLKAFVAAVVGGIGNVPGAMIGGFIMGLAETLVAASSIPIGKLWGSDYTIVGSNYRQALGFLVLILVLLLRPSGLFGRHEPEKV
jgi:branched-chain amino acid transport system permease protein